MKLSEVKGFENVVSFFFVKFSSNIDHLNALQEGNLYMNNFKYFIDLEKSTGIRGMGDQYEVANVMNDVNLKIYDPETNELLGEIPSGRSIFRYDDLLNKPLFCLFSVGPDMVEVIEDDGETIEARIVFGEEQKENIVENFGEHALVINAVDILEKVKQTFGENDIHYVSGLVEYSDFNVNMDRRMNAFANQDMDMFFQKDNFFKDQNEFRIVILNKDVERNFEINVGPISGVSIGTQSLVNGDFGIRLKRKN